MSVTILATTLSLQTLSYPYLSSSCDIISLPSCFMVSSTHRLLRSSSKAQQTCSTREHTRARWTCRRGRNNSNSSVNSSKGRGRSAKRSELYESMSQYGEHFTFLLERELEAEQISFKMSRYGSIIRYAVASRKPRIFSNDVFALVTSQRDDNHRTPRRTDVQFGKGDLVDIYEEDGNDIPTNENVNKKIQGVVLSKVTRSQQQLLVTFPLGSVAAKRMCAFVQEKTPLRVERGTNSLAYDRAIAAVNEVVKEGPGTSPIARLMVTSFRDTSSSEKITLFTSARGQDDAMTLPQDIYRDDISSNSQQQSEWEVLASESINDVKMPKVSVLMKTLSDTLNPSQRNAIRTALTRRLTLIQGPPGTGKTKTAAHIISGALQLGLGPVLAAAASNVAADNLTRAIISACPNARILRFGRASAVGDDLWESTVDAELERNASVCAARLAAAAIGNDGRIKELMELERNVIAKVINKAQVIVATCVGCGGPELSKCEFRFVVVDEATQATEPDTLMAVMGKQVKRVVLVGDHHQLPPTTLSDHVGETVETGLEVSLFARLCACGVRTCLLNVQYRMHPKISKFPNIQFYAGRLRDGVDESARILPMSNVPNWLTRNVVIFDVSDGKEERGSDENEEDITEGTSILNKREAEVVVNIVSELLKYGDDHDDGFRPNNLAIISPYAAQVRLLRDEISLLEISQKFNSSCPQRVSENVEVNSVDGFQGREQDVVLISAVRSNAQRNVGFLRDWRRLNVAITRARRLLIVVCDCETVCSDEQWSSFVKWVRRNGKVINEKSLHQALN